MVTRCLAQIVRIDRGRGSQVAGQAQQFRVLGLVGWGEIREHSEYQQGLIVPSLGHRDEDHTAQRVLEPRPAVFLGAITDFLTHRIDQPAIAFECRFGAFLQLREVALCKVEELPCTRRLDIAELAHRAQYLLCVSLLEKKLQAARDNPGLFDEFRQSIARKTRGFLAPEYNIRCIEAAVKLPFDEGMAVERELFMELMAGPQSTAQQYFFFAERQAAKIPDIPKDTPERPINKVGVIGAGTMGGGISMNFANIGMSVTIVETTQEALDRGLGIIRKNYENTAAKGRISEADVEARCGLITGSLALEDLADCDLIIEAVFENMDIKKDIFSKLDAIAKPGAILASNTSALDVNEIASVTSRPGDVLGLHFFSPANVMKLLEVVRGEATDKDVLKTCMSMARRIKKVPACVGVCPGFVGNRILFQRQAQGQKLILEGALPHQVDKVLVDFGLPMGVFQMSDLAGLDIGWSAETSKGETIRDVLCEAGRRGQKTGAGYYDYDEKRTPSPSPEVEKIILEFSEKAGLERRENMYYHYCYQHRL